MTVAWSFILDNLPENMVFFTIVNQLAGPQKTREEGGLKRWLPASLNILIIRPHSPRLPFGDASTFRKLLIPKDRGRKFGDRDPSSDFELILEASEGTTSTNRVPSIWIDM